MQPDDFYEFPAIERDRDERLAEEAGEQLGGRALAYIRFDFPGVAEEPPAIFYAGDSGDPPAPGFAPTIATAKVYESKEVAERFLANAYGEEVRKWGSVHEFDGGAS